MSKSVAIILVVLASLNVVQFYFHLSHKSDIQVLQLENQSLTDKVLDLHSELDKVESGSIKGMIDHAGDAVSENVGKALDTVKKKLEQYNAKKTPQSPPKGE